METTSNMPMSESVSNLTGNIDGSNLQDRYDEISKSEWFKNAHEGKSLCENVKFVPTEPYNPMKEINNQRDILIDELLKWCDKNSYEYKDTYGYVHRQHESFTFYHLKELLTKIRESEYYKSLKNR